jgi:hypothetical protein
MHLIVWMQLKIEFHGVHWVRDLLVVIETECAYLCCVDEPCQKHLHWLEFGLGQPIQWCKTEQSLLRRAQHIV